MNIISIHEIPSKSKLISVQDTAMLLNLTERRLVDELLESFTDFTDEDIIEEIVDTLELPLTCVVDTTTNLVQGYIHGKVVA